MKEENNLREDDRPIMVSVCCATYNHEKYIEKALQGFANQITNFRFEIIVHEDVSTDGTREIVQKYVEKFPDLFVPIFQKENQYSKGWGIVAHNMLSKARGKYIAWCEGDDYWIDEYKLQKQFDVMEANNECSICVHKVKPVFEDINIIEKPNARANGIRNKYYMNAGVIEKEKMARAIWLEGGYPFHTSSYFIVKQALQARIDNKELFLRHMTGDMVMMRLCLMHGKFYFMEDVMSCRRRGVNGSWSARWALKSGEDKAKFYKDFALGESLYDKYSEYEFHEYIQQHVFNLLGEACLYSTDGIRKQLKDNPLSISIVHDKKTFMMYVRYCIMKVSPKLYKFIFDLQKKLIKQ